MLIQVVHSLPAFQPNVLRVCLIAVEQIAAAKSELSHFQDLIGEKTAEAGKKQILSIAEGWVVAMGMGATPTLEQFRKAVHRAVGMANEYQCDTLVIAVAGGIETKVAKAISESAILSNYQFLQYKSQKNIASLQTVQCVGSAELEAAIAEGTTIAEAVCITRDLVNEPVITLTAEELAKRAAALGEVYGFTADIFNHAKIESLKMGGLLAVNYGSILPPTFTILEYKPANATNEKPIVWVGKGVVFDTGGLSLKPTPNSMDSMKCDMAGAGAVIGAMCGIAKLGVNKHVIALIPATDNRPGENAYVPGDVITMYDGSTVEVLNTDAEGRMILGDALAYAKQYNPELVIDLATLTGASVVAIGGVGLAMMSTADESVKNALKAAGEQVYERLVEFPLWDEYAEMIKSDIADMKNIGGAGAGAITAAKFLQHFTDYPWIHLDIAGAAWNTAPDSYRGKNGTGVGVRLLIEFLQSLA